MTPNLKEVVDELPAKYLANDRSSAPTLLRSAFLPSSSFLCSTVLLPVTLQPAARLCGGRSCDGESRAGIIRGSHAMVQRVQDGLPPPQAPQTSATHQVALSLARSNPPLPVSVACRPCSSRARPCKAVQHACSRCCSHRATSLTKPMTKPALRLASCNKYAVCPNGCSRPNGLNGPACSPSARIS